jgi:hypothetical protein
MNRESGSTAAMHSTWSWMPLAVLAAMVISMAAFVALHGPAMREQAEWLKTEQIDRENRALCAKLGLPDGSDRFADCAGILLEARRLHEERLAIEAVGIL